MMQIYDIIDLSQKNRGRFMRKTYENVCGKAHFLYVPYQKGREMGERFWQAGYFV